MLDNLSVDTLTCGAEERFAYVRELPFVTIPDVVGRPDGSADSSRSALVNLFQKLCLIMVRRIR